jgi:two-component system, chemotaxis family, chemotaxis protein CheY
MSECIIVAEDSAPNRTILVHLLKKLNFEVIEAENGQVAWQEMQGNPDLNVVAVISDIMMPLMDGIEFLRKVRESEKFSNIPFVLVTAVSDKEYIHLARNLKVNGYILKPVTFDRVTKKLQEIFPQRKFPKLAG